MHSRTVIIDGKGRIEPCCNAVECVFGVQIDDLGGSAGLDALFED